MRCLRVPVFFAVALALGCEPGDGSTLDDRGRAYDHPQAPGLASKYGAIAMDPSYRDISGEFFEALCVGCHSGATAPKGLILTEEDAWDNLVGVPSVEQPDVLLVDPERPEASYLVIKLAGGTPMSGRRMPRNRPARPAAEVDVIRTWIADGAQRN